MMTPEEFEQKMNDISTGSFYGTDRMYDEEDMHRDMDNIMCNLLRDLGYGKGIDIFEDTPKWYS